MLRERGIFVVLQPEDLVGEVVFLVARHEMEELSEQLRNPKLLGQDHPGMWAACCATECR